MRLFRIGRVDFRLTVPGLHNVTTPWRPWPWACTARAQVAAAAALAAFSPPKFRMQVMSWDRGHSRRLLQRQSLLHASALATLAAFHAKGRRIAVLGDMLNWAWIPRSCISKSKLSDGDEGR